jgi:hypothetical protein
MAKKRKHHADAGELIERAKEGAKLEQYWHVAARSAFAGMTIEWFHQRGALSNASTARLRWR